MSALIDTPESLSHFSPEAIINGERRKDTARAALTGCDGPTRSAIIFLLSRTQKQHLPVALFVAGDSGGLVGGARRAAMDLEVIERVLDIAELEVHRLAHELAGGDDLVDDEAGLE